MPSGSHISNVIGNHNIKLTDGTCAVYSMRNARLFTEYVRGVPRGVHFDEDATDTSTL